MKNDAPIDESLLGLQQELIETLAERMDEMDSDWQRLTGQSWDSGLAAQLARATHNLRGEAAIFGLSRLVEPTRELETIFKRSVASGLDAEERGAVETKLQELRGAADSYRDDKPELPAPLREADTPPSGRTLLYLVREEAGSELDLVEQLWQYGFAAESFGDLARVEKAVAERRPDILIFDIALREDMLDDLGKLAGIHQEGDHRLPLVFISERHDMEARLMANRAGGVAYFTRPLRFNLLLERLEQLTDRQPLRPYEVLIVDDDLAQAQYYSKALEQAGMSVSILVDPMAVLTHLERRRPDVILLDLYMPECSGQEIAAVLQQHESFLSIPLVFLSSEDDPDQQIEALGLGGEDFLTKPIDPKHLIATLKPRAERGRALGSQIHRDGLTGLMTHSGQKARLELELTRAEREGYEISLAMIDLDDFKSINDEHGHTAGDRALCGLASVLKQRLRRTDIVARYGGDEFVAVLPKTRAENAGRILQEVADTFRQLVFPSENGRFSATVSCGIASFPQWPDAEQLTAAADRALYDAKRQGRDRVVVDT